MARTKKQPVNAEVRKEWLKRYEVDGESPPQIAAKDRFDARTVRKQLDLAKEERETREARLLVLRTAMENHYDDLRKFAEKLNASISGRSEITYSPDDDLIESALKQHLPRSPIWNMIAKRKSLALKIDEEKAKLVLKIKELVKSDKKILSLPKDLTKGVGTGIENLLIFEAEQWINGNAGHTLKESVVMEPAEEGKVNPRIGFSHLGVMDLTSAKQIIKTALDAVILMESRIKELDEYRTIQRTKADIDTLGLKLREELAVVRLRRIVPGRCRYCPL